MNDADFDWNFEIDDDALRINLKKHQKWHPRNIGFFSLWVRGYHTKPQLFPPKRNDTLVKNRKSPLPFFLNLYI